MSYEKVKIGSLRRIIKKSTGEVHNFLTVELLQPYDLYLNDDALKQLPLFEKFQDQELLLEVTWGEYNGKPSLNIVGNGSPMRVPESLSVSNVNPVKELDPVPESEKAATSPLFKSSANK